MQLDAPGNSVVDPGGSAESPSALAPARVYWRKTVLISVTSLSHPLHLQIGTFTPLL
jgi:hypothetical protein